MPIESVQLSGAPNGEMYAIPSHHYSDDPTEAVFFYGGPFSNFVGGPWIIENEGRIAQYETVEHFFAASKATTSQDHDIIRNMRGPWDAKRAGRRTDLRPDWEEVKFEIMLIALRVKFDVVHVEHPNARRLQQSYRVALLIQQSYRVALLKTGDRLIAEDSPTDYEWGIRDRHHGYGGTNLLGKALMQVRDELRS